MNHIFVAGGTISFSAKAATVALCAFITCSQMHDLPEVALTLADPVLFQQLDVTPAPPPDINTLGPSKSPPLILVTDSAVFNALAKMWKDERNPLLSSNAVNLHNPSYLKIIGMGDRALPLILRALEHEVAIGEPDDWFAALASITRVNPVPPRSRGVAREMALAWLDWGFRESRI